MVERILGHLRDERRLNEVSAATGIKVPRLSEMANGKRAITPYYIAKLITGDFVRIEHFLQGRKLEDLPIDERRVLNKIFEDDELTDILEQIREKGIDVKKVLKSLI